MIEGLGSTVYKGTPHVNHVIVLYIVYITNGMSTHSGVFPSLMILSDP